MLDATAPYCSEHFLAAPKESDLNWRSDKAASKEVKCDGRIVDLIIIQGNESPVKLVLLTTLVGNACFPIV
jgi:hypothetical protein